MMGWPDASADLRAFAARAGGFFGSPSAVAASSKRRCAQFGQSPFELRVGKSSVDFAVEFPYDIRRRVFRSVETVPDGCLVAGQDFPTVGMSARASERVAPVTASARRLPAFTYSIDAGNVPK
jgi:hypothetical protein